MNLLKPDLFVIMFPKYNYTPLNLEKTDKRTHISLYPCKEDWPSWRLSVPLTSPAVSVLALSGKKAPFHSEWHN